MDANTDAGQSGFFGADLRPRLRRLALRCALPLLALLGLPACLSYASLVHEFDGLVGYDSENGLESETYSLRRTTKSYGTFLEPFRAFSPLLGMERTSVDVERPHWRLRDRLSRMVAQSGNELERLTELGWRCLLVLDQDSSPLNRATAIRGLAELAEHLPGRPEVGDRGLPLPGRSRTALAVAFRDAATGLVRDLAELWMREGSEARDEAARKTFEERVRALGSLEASTLAAERGRLRVLGEALLYERDRRTQEVIARELLRCLTGALFGGLAQGLADPEPVPRKAAVEALWKLGREDYLPYAIAALRSATLERVPPSDVNRALVDEDPTLRRSLVGLAGATALPFGSEAVASGPSPVRFLVDTSQDDPDRGLRIAARLALSKLAGRSAADLDGAWIAAWWERIVTTGSAEQREPPQD